MYELSSSKLYELFGPRIVQLICAPQLDLAKLVCCNNVTSNLSATVIFQGMYKL